MQPLKDLTPYNFLSDLIFHPEHAKLEDQATSLTISILTGVFSLGIFPLCVGIGWGVQKVITLIEGERVGTVGKVNKKSQAVLRGDSEYSDPATTTEKDSQVSAIGLRSSTPEAQTSESQGVAKIELGPLAEPNPIANLEKNKISDNDDTLQIQNLDEVKNEVEQLQKNSDFEVIYFRKHNGPIAIILLAKDPLFLKEKLESISQYTKKADPNFKLSNFEINELEITDTEELSKGFTHFAYLDDILPRPIKVLYGEHRINTSSGNCHGAALVASGIFPVMANFGYSPTTLDLTSHKTDKIGLEQLSSGDLVTLYGPGGDHSFVFIDHDISLSMNGIGQKLELQRTSDILKRYKFPKKILRTSLLEIPSQSIGEKKGKGKIEQIVILRKHEDWNFPESVMPGLIEYYQFCNNAISCQLPGDKFYDRLKPIAEKFKRLAEEPQDDPRIKLAWQTLYERATSSMPNSITEELNSKSVDENL